LCHQKKDNGSEEIGANTNMEPPGTGKWTLVTNLIKTVTHDNLVTKLLPEFLPFLHTHNVLGDTGRSVPV